LIFGYNLGVNQHFFTKFGTQMKNRHPKATYLSESVFRKSKMADGRHLEFRFLAIISASINIFAPTKIKHKTANFQHKTANIKFNVVAMCC